MPTQNSFDHRPLGQDLLNDGPIQNIAYWLDQESYQPASGTQVQSVLNFGADPSGKTDSSAAILKAVNAAAALTPNTGGGHSRGTVYFPPGIYLVTTTACLTPTTNNSLPGLLFQGAGKWASVLRFGTLSAPTYFYDNGSTARTSFDTFMHLGFEGMNPANYSGYSSLPTNAYGMRFWSAGNEQGNVWIDCRFYYFTGIFDMEGTNTASEMRFYGCEFALIATYFYTVNNLQSFDHEFYGCNCSANFGDVFVIGAGAGGLIKIYGGFWSLQSDAGSNHYLLNANAGGLTATAPVVVSGVYMELIGNYANLLIAPATNGVRTHFSDCSFLTTATSNLTTFVNIAAYSTVDFSDCLFTEQTTGQFQFAITALGGYNEDGTITFQRCSLPVDWSDRCSINGGGYGGGSIRAIDCRGTNVGAASAGAHWAHDFDFGYADLGIFSSWTNYSNGAGLGSPTNETLRLKSALLKLPTDTWPSNAESTLKLPRGAIIKNIHLRKPAGTNNSDSTSTTMNVGRNDKSGTPHLTTSAASMSAATSGDTTNYFYNVSSTVNERTLRLYSSAVTTGVATSGFVIVEYY